MEYETIINAYQPSEATIQLMRQTPFVLLAGITGAGRDTIISRLTTRGGYYPYVTHTTRAKRVNNGVPEIHGIEYYFISTDQALEMMQQQAYVEVSNVHGRINGLSLAELEKIHASRRIGISDVTPEGVEKYMKLSPDNVQAIFVVPPSFEEWVKRIKSRYNDENAFQESWPPRRASAIQELRGALAKSYYHFVINDDLAQAVEACDAIAHGHPVSEAENAAARKIVTRLLARIERQEVV